ncbi:AAA family ATPase [Aureibacillus halotolerans]|uniref:AAA domain-containing protein n=1 Tax=Aureibacillus halotolerans TaxID=1508390 RepID=A0A4R6UCF7_9BACI|nr:AAA family ATPase [Aureibacillus halotolerans]TDQ42699.1 hypothetical protein EV213_101128 [Aureibacillus halotolerans]
MIVWINGSFGVGKTQTAYELKRRLSKAHLFDPEKIGYRIQKDVPEEAQLEDFQDYPIWRTYIVELLTHIELQGHKGVTIVPMTITNELYYTETIETLKERGIDVLPISLIASKATIQQRLKKRGDGPKTWNWHQIDRCVEAMERLPAHRINTAGIDVQEVTEKIAAIANLKLAKRRSRWLYSLWIQLRHARF